MRINHKQNLTRFVTQPATAECIAKRMTEQGLQAPALKVSLMPMVFLIEKVPMTDSEIITAFH